MKYLFVLIIILLNPSATAQELIVIGTLQDGGSPHMNCKKDCCAQPKENDFVASIAICDSSLSVVIDATPDFVEQTNYLREQFGHNNLAIFLTHAHVGHYSGLIHLGREAANTHKVPVYVMNKMFNFLFNNGPWDQLIRLENIELRGLQESLPVTLENGIVMTPVLVPHRDEYSETVGYYIKGQNKTALYIPDIDKWSAWEQNILAIIPLVDYAFIDGTFYEDGEVPRPMAEVPHPFISESVLLLQHLTPENRNKVHFIHLNHSNPTRNKTNPGRMAIEASGFRFAEFGQRFTL